MKRCPECRRDYFDDSLLYCLDDGSALLDGPGSGIEPPTAVLREITGPAEAATRAHVDVPQTNPLPRQSTAESRSHSRTGIGIGLLVLVVAVGGFLTMRTLKASPEINSIAVLPFVNDSGNTDLDYLSDGMTETLISSLSRLPGLDVKPRSAVFHYKGKDADAQTVSRDLGVRSVLNGRVAQRGADLSVYLELIDTSQNKIIWSDTYNRKQTDLLTLQAEIARDISAKLQSKLSGADVAKVTKDYTNDPEAYQLYLKGRYHWNKRTPDSLRQATELYKQAIEKDPSFALAYSGLGEAYVLFPFYGVASPAESMPQAKAAVDRALAIDEFLAAAHAARGKYLAYYEYDHAGSEREFRRAIELDPNYATARQWLGLDFLVLTRRFDEGIRELKAAIEKDPLSPVIGSDTAVAYWDAGRFDEAAEQAKKVLALEPNFAYAWCVLGQALDSKGRYPEAIADIRKSLELADDPYTRAVLIRSLVRAGNRAEAQNELASLEAMASKSYVPNFCLAIARTALGDKEAAIRLLQKDVEQRSAYVATIDIDPGLTDLRSDPRFKDLLRRMNLPE